MLLLKRKFIVPVATTPGKTTPFQKGCVTSRAEVPCILPGGIN